MNITQKTTPNFTKGTNIPKAVVIHIMAGSLVGTDSWFASATSHVSAHYGIGKTGEIHQYVKETDEAWHAGIVENPTWKLLDPKVSPNRMTVGIEHEGQANDIWTDEMKKASSELIRDVCTRWKIPLDRDHVVGHYEIKSSKPNCPAVNKGIIDELISLAKGKTKEEAIKMIEEGLVIIKSI